MIGLQFFHDQATEEAMDAAIEAKRKSMLEFQKLGNNEKVMQLRYDITDMMIDKRIILDNRAHSE